MTRHPSAKTASTTVSVHPLLAERWSPRRFDPALRTRQSIGDLLLPTRPELELAAA